MVDDEVVAERDPHARRATPCSFGSVAGIEQQEHAAARLEIRASRSSSSGRKSRLRPGDDHQVGPGGHVAVEQVHDVDA